MAGADLVVQEVITSQGLLESEQMFLAPVATQATCNGRFIGSNAAIAKLRESLPVALARNNGAQDTHAGLAGNVTDDVGKL